MRRPRFLPQNAQNLRVSQHAKVAFRHEQELLTKDREDNRRVVHTQRIGKNVFEAEIWDAGSNTGESINYLRRTILRQGSNIYIALWLRNLRQESQQITLSALLQLHAVHK